MGSGLCFWKWLLPKGVRWLLTFPLKRQTFYRSVPLRQLSPHGHLLVKDKIFPFLPTFTAKILQIFHVFKLVFWHTDEVESIVANKSRAGPVGADCTTFPMRYRIDFKLSLLRKRVKQSSAKRTLQISAAWQERASVSHMSQSEGRWGFTDKNK